MSKGYSLHIGVNETDPNHYENLSPLGACVNDARFWRNYAKKLGYAPKSFTNKTATSKKVIRALRQYASVMQPGDIAFITYSGHGGQIPNEKPDHVDKEKMDQTWCLYDRQLLDDELYATFSLFAEGTRIIIISDSCHSGTITRAAEIDISDMMVKGLAEVAGSRGMRSRQLPEEVESRIVMGHYEKVYAPIQKKYKNKTKRKEVKAAVKLLAACQDHQVTYDGKKYGLFTENLKAVIEDNENRKLTASQLIAAVKERYAFPYPNFFEYGTIIPSFDDAFPFTINIENATVSNGYRDAALKAGKTRSRDDDYTNADINRSAQVEITISGKPASIISGGAEATVLSIDETDKGKRVVIELHGVPYRHAWSAAHALQVKLQQQNITAEVAPLLSYNPNDQFLQSRQADENNKEYIPEWPPANSNPPVKLGWHLSDEHSQLKSAAELVARNPAAHIKIAHIDTGYIEGHIALPEKLDRINGRSFVSKEPVHPAEDGKGGMDGHGLGTMCILAGGKVSLEDTHGEYEGYIGGAWMADVLPLRTSESVVIMNSRNFCEAIDYAISKCCEVVTMSMAGKPDKAMAAAVNRAYEAGVVIVSAASNCWYAGPMKVLPKCVLYPAAFERVIAATGVMQNHRPYDSDFLLEARLDFTKYMQGCWGPASRMTKALAAYTPNTPWANKKVTFLKSGGGTSSATPQVAAAAALYIAHYRNDLMAAGYYEAGRQWMKVEAVRHALFTSANKTLFADWRKYYGNGILKAYDALQIPVAKANKLKKAPDAQSGFGGIFEIIGSFFKNRRLFRSETPRPSEEALATEILHLLQTDSAFYDDYAKLDLSNPKKMEAYISKPAFTKKVLASPFASDYLKEAVVA